MYNFLDLKKKIKLIFILENTITLIKVKIITEIIGDEASIKHQINPVNEDKVVK